MLWELHVGCLCLIQAHREVFEYLIEDFKTYKPLLSAIKNEYEMMLAAQREQIRQMEPLKVSQGERENRVENLQKTFWNAFFLKKMF